MKRDWKKFDIRGHQVAIGNIAELSEYQLALLMHIGLKGPASAYGAHRALRQNLSTMQKALNRLKELSLVQFIETVATRTGQEKHLYALTSRGLLVAIDHVTSAGYSGSHTDFYQLLDGNNQICPPFLKNLKNYVKDGNGEIIPSPSWSLYKTFPTLTENFWIILLATVAARTYSRFKGGADCEPEWQTDIEDEEKRSTKRQDADLFHAFYWELTEFIVVQIDKDLMIEPKGPLSYLLSVVDNNDSLWIAVGKKLTDYRDYYVNLIDSYSGILKTLF